ncbi:MAG: hypothetical protein CMM60_00050 [Rhodospirillaceae bacterium]|jgi:hypothetical protein|nr:hypothetical protein [Rhodospirillaceae bacterium]|tara:strand:- start:630 stop:1112 length:483 start_codon:yes stop_codon:yes gene_type:complete
MAGCALDAGMTNHMRSEANRPEPGFMNAPDVKGNLRLQPTHRFTVNHSAKEYAVGDIHSNTAESYLSILERARIGVFHYMSHTHLPRYLNEASFRWSNRIPQKTTKKKGKRKTQWAPLPFMWMLTIIIIRAFGRQLRRSRNGGLMYPYSSAGSANALVQA